MTSPTQLKYLNAMGIPVWVSRDLISDVKIQRDNSKDVNVDSINETLSNSVINLVAAATHTHTQASNNNSSAQSILESLNESTPVVKTKSPLENLVSNTIDKSHVHAALNTSHSPVIPYIEASAENLLFKSEQHYVFASGSKDAEWLIIGHSPEQFTGIGSEPFADEAGILLDNMLRAASVPNPQKQAYMVNVLNISHASVKTLDENANKDLYLKLIAIIHKVKPKIVLLVGQLAAQNLLHIDDPLIIMRSKIHHITEAKIPCVVTYYPSYLLQKPIDKRKAWNDLKLAMSTLTDVS